jgi:hypothetical protein
MLSFTFRRLWFFLITGLLLTGCGAAGLPEISAALTDTAAASFPTASPTGDRGLTSSSPSPSPEIMRTSSPAPQITLRFTATALLPTQSGNLASPTTNPRPVASTTIPPSHTPVSREVCDRAAPGVPLDVTIPDGTRMDPGEAFTKIWRLQNTGTCTWTSEYTLSFFSGSPMSAPQVLNLLENVEPGSTIDLAVDMVAPTAGGLYQGNWKLQNSSSDWFGIGPLGDSVFWVQIQLIAPPTPTETATSTPSPTPTETPTVTPTPTSDTGEGLTLVIPVNSLIDLENRRLAPGSAEANLRYELLSSPGGEQRQLVPLGETHLEWFGAARPALGDCLAGSTEPLILDGLTAGGYLCYRTPGGIRGWVRLGGFSAADNALTLELFNWPREP